MAVPYRLIADALRNGRVIPFLGAGASIGVRDPTQTPWTQPDDPVGKQHLPTGRELSGYFARLTNLPEEEATDLAKVAQYYDLVGGRTALHEALHTIFNRDYQPPRLHQFLAGVAAKTRKLLVVTTNYDDLLERAFLNAGVPFDLVTYSVGGSEVVLVRRHGQQVATAVPANKLDVDPEAQNVIYKIHGSCERVRVEDDQYVITEDDYIDFLSRLIKKKAVPAVFAMPFRERHFLFLGYGLGDWNFRVVFRRIGEERYRQRTKLTSWAIQVRPSQLEARFWQERGVEVYDQALDDFVGMLEKV